MVQGVMKGSVLARTFLSTSDAHCLPRTQRVRPHCTQSQRPPRSHTTVQTPSRRRIVGLGVGLALLPARWAWAEDGATSTYTEPVSGFSLDYPKSWIVAVKRAPSEGAKSETLCVAGNFKDVDTVSVSRESIAQSSEGGATWAPGQTADEIVQGLTAAIANNSGTLKFELYQSAFRTLSDGQRAVDYEYATESCRGRKIEGAGGELFCVGVNNETPVQTIKRRVVATAVQRNGYTWVCSASAAQDRWSEVGATLQATVATFRV